MKKAQITNWTYGDVFVIANETVLAFDGKQFLPIQRRSFDPKDGVLVEAHSHNDTPEKDTAMRCISLDQGEAFAINPETQIIRKATKAEIRTLEKETALAWLRNVLKPGTIVYTAISNPSNKSCNYCRRFYIGTIEESFGQSRPAIQEITAWVGQVFGKKISPVHGGIPANYGSDTVAHLDMYLWPEARTKERRGDWQDACGCRLVHRNL